MKKGRIGLRRAVALTTLVALAVTLVVLVPGAFGGGVTGAAFTTVNPTYDGADFCKNGTGYVNCNIYEGKQYVWLNGGPSTAYVGDGDYFFAVLAPGGQHDPNDGSANNLSDTTCDPWSCPKLNADLSPVPSGDLYTNREFHVTGGVIDNIYGSSHILDSNKIRLFPYDDTTNPGGVYILAICSLKDGIPVAPSDCKYDAFKVAAGETPTPDADAPTVSKDAYGTYDTTFTWDSAKSVSAPTTVNVDSGSATFHYTVTATHSVGSNSNFAVSGKITVLNPNGDDIVVHVSDALSDNTACTIKDGSTTIGANDDVTVPSPSKQLDYSCSISGTDVPVGLTNTVTVTWPEQLLDDGSHLAANLTGIQYTTDPISFVSNPIDECTTLTDTFDGSATTLGVACVNNTPPFAKDAGNTLDNWAASYASATRTFTFTYDRSVAAPTHGCVTKNNTASFQTNDNSLGDSTTGDNSSSVTVCRNADAPTVSKDASGAYKKTYTWDSAKSVAAPTTVNVNNGSATFHYTITATHSAGANSNITVSGKITVFNTNPADIVVHVTDALSNGSSCTVKDGSTTIGASDNITVSSPSKQLDFSCSIAGTTVPAGLTNTATVTWAEQTLANGSHLAANLSPGVHYTTGTISFTPNLIDECITVTDTFDGSATTLGVACANNTPPFAKDAGNSLANWAAAYAAATRKFTFTYDRSVAAPATGCVTKNNTATFQTSDNSLSDPTTGDNSASVKVCRVPPDTGALTIGFWQNKNGQGIITGGASVSGVCKSGTWLRQYAPFQDLSATASCSGVATYVYDIIKAANASGSAMNAMLKAQMLATALDVYFSDPALGTNKINASVPIGGIKIDLTLICKMIDGSGGTGTCSGTYQDVSSAFGGATSLTVSQILAYAASQSNAGGSVWYGQVKATQELAKNTFDAINNKVAFQAP